MRYGLITLQCVVALAIGCSDADHPASAQPSGPEGGTTSTASSHASGSGGAQGGSGGSSIVMSASGSGGTTSTAGTGVSGSGAAGTAASGGTGTAGSMQTKPPDPCAGMPAACIKLCEGGNCECHCSNAEPCPAAAPAPDSPCNTTDLCGYGEPACHKIFECFTRAWKLVADTCADGPMGSCPATLPQAQATACLTRRCGYDGVLCQCAPPTCGGAILPPETFCGNPPQAACLTPPKDGAACVREGQRCGAECCGQRFTCTQGEWTSAFIACPP